MTLKIRVFDHNREYDDLTSIDAHAQEEYWSFEDFKKRLKEKSITCLVAEKDNRVVGFIVYEVYNQRLQIHRIGVLPYYRKKGVGKAILERLKLKLSTKRPLIAAEVRETNLPIQLFLKAVGYRASEILWEYYEDTKEDCFVFHYRASTSVEKSS